MSEIRCVTFNWPQRYTSGGKKADEIQWNVLTNQGDVIGLTESMHTYAAILSNEHGAHQFHGHHDDEGTTLAWSRARFETVEKGRSPLNPPMPITPGTKSKNPHPAKDIVWAKLRDVETDLVWTFGVVHFVASKHLGGDTVTIWETQRDAVLAFIAEHGPRAVVMGDYNAEPGDDVAQPLWDAGLNVQTSKSYQDGRSIDWIVSSRDVEPVSVRTMLDRDQSDHYPIQAVVRAGAVDPDPDPDPREAVLFRIVTPAGTSEGVVFADGTVVVRWSVPERRTAVYANLAALLAVLGDDDELLPLDGATLTITV